MKKNRKGFTLVEIIVVVVILAVLMAVAVPSVFRYLDSADDAGKITQTRAAIDATNQYIVKYRHDNPNADWTQEERDRILELAGLDGEIQNIVNTLDYVDYLEYVTPDGTLVTFAQDYEAYSLNDYFTVGERGVIVDPNRPSDPVAGAIYDIFAKDAWATAVDRDGKPYSYVVLGTEPNRAVVYFTDKPNSDDVKEEIKKAAGEDVEIQNISTSNTTISNEKTREALWNSIKAANPSTFPANSELKELKFSTSGKLSYVRYEYIENGKTVKVMYNFETNTTSSY